MARQRFLMLVLLITTSMNAGITNAQQPGQLTTHDFEKGIKQPGIQLLDVRTSEEYQSGHLKEAFLADWTNKEQFIESVQSLDKSKTVYTYCLSGVRSDAASAWLRENGFNAYNLYGGIAAWKRAGKPVEAAAIVKQMSLQEYQALIPINKTVLVDVSAIWCPACKNMNRVIDSLATSKDLQFHLVKIDGGEQTKVCKKLKVDVFPTFIVYKGGKEVWRHSGIAEANKLAKAIK
jgi:rhodanese-related sulfurtransferase